MNEANPRPLRVGTAPVSFGVDEVIGDDAWVPDPNELLSWMSEIGYQGTEMGPPGYLGSASSLRDRLASHQLEMIGGFLPQHFSRVDRVDEDRRWLEENLRALREAAGPDSQPFAVLSEAIDEPVRVAWAGRCAANPDTRLDRDRWQALVDNLHTAAELCRKHGLEPVFHPHAGTYIETAEEIAQLADAMDPAIVGLCLDTGHFCFGGADAATSIRAYASLVRHVHIKDCRTSVRDQVAAEGGDLDAAVRGGVFCPLGSGDIDLDEAVQALRDIDYDGWLVVEQDQLLTPQDTPASVVAGQRANLQYLRALGL